MPSKVGGFVEMAIIFAERDAKLRQRIFRMGRHRWWVMLRFATTRFLLPPANFCFDGFGPLFSGEPNQKLMQKMRFSWSDIEWTSVSLGTLCQCEPRLLQGTLRLAMTYSCTVCRDAVFIGLVAGTFLEETIDFYHGFTTRCYGCFLQHFPSVCQAIHGFMAKSQSQIGCLARYKLGKRKLMP